MFCYVLLCFAKVYRMTRNRFSVKNVSDPSPEPSETAREAPEGFLMHLQGSRKLSTLTNIEQITFYIGFYMLYIGVYWFL